MDRFDHSASARKQRDQETAAAVADLLHTLRRPPTVREIGERLRLRSSSTVQRRLERCELRGLLERRAGAHAAHGYWPVSDGTCALCGQGLPKARIEVM